jgi:hypothetical protein
MILDKQRLLHGPYQAPALRVGDRTDCLLRGTVVITGWTAARISWPRCRRPVGNSHPSLLLEAELARADRTEAATAVIPRRAGRAPGRYRAGAGLAGGNVSPPAAFTTRRQGERHNPRSDPR